MDKWALQKITFESNPPAPAAGETVLVANFVKGNAVPLSQLSAEDGGTKPTGFRETLEKEKSSLKRKMLRDCACPPKALRRRGWLPKVIFFR